MASFRGPQTAATVRAPSERIQELAAQQRASRRRVLVLIDLRQLHLRDSESGGRTEGRRLLATLDVDLVALMGPSSLITISMYLARAARPGLRLRTFKTVRRAEAWLLGTQMHEISKRPTVALTASVIIGLIGLLALAGWQFSNPYLRGFLPGLRPMNPLGAVGLLAMSVGFFAYWRGNPQPLRVVGGVGIILGVVSLLPLRTDYLLYGDQVAALAPHTELADSAALCFIALGIMALVAKRAGWWVQPLEYGLTVLVGGLSLFNIFGQLYAHDVIYGLSDSFVMALNLALAFAVAAGASLLLVLRRQTGAELQLPRTGWMVAIALVFAQVAIYSAWSQSVARNQTEAEQRFSARVDDLTASVNNRLQTYIDALYGFRGLFTASDRVSQGDFQKYYTSLELARSHPELRGIAFIAALKDGELPAFVAERRRDTSLLPGGNPGFKIQSQTAGPLHYVATYSTTAVDAASSTALGLDVSSVPGRAALYDATLAAGGAYASGTITFLKTASQPASPGFFLALPVKSASSDRYLGIVSASFNYRDFFPSLFDRTELVKDLQVRLVDNDGGLTIYESQNAANSKGTPMLERALTIQVANRAWLMRVAAPVNFGVSANQGLVPPTILVGGQLFCLLLGVVFVLLSRARRQALDLADAVTADLKRERNQVVQLDRKHEAILNSIGEGLIGLDRHGRIELVNAAVQNLLGFKSEEMLGKPLTDVVVAIDEKGRRVPNSHRPEVLALQRGRIYSAKLHYVHHQGSSFPVDLTAAPIIFEGKPIGIIEVFRDISQEYALDKAKTEFVSLASHQLRTPLSAVNWYSEMLLSGDTGKLNDDQAAYLREIYEGNQRMTALVTALLDVSRLELGKIANHPELTSMAQIVDSVEKELANTIEEKHLTLHRSVNPKMPPVSADPKLLRMIVQNLLSNAVKYTPASGTVDVVVRTATEADLARAAVHRHDEAFVYLSVRDTGYGIPKAQQDKVFQKLFRADNVRKLSVEGTGLGLYVVKEVADKLGGRVWFDSMESIGTTFYAVLPFKTKPSKVN